MILVDGNNVMGSRPDGWWRDRAGAGRRLAEEIAGWAREAREEVAVVFDGRPFPHAAEGIEVAWAERAGPDAADDVIAARAAEHGGPASLTVVTSDAGLAARVRASGAVVEGAGKFLRRIAVG
jgi:predicted RNA-binding protein with PIN domain